MGDCKSQVKRPYVFIAYSFCVRGSSTEQKQFFDSEFRWHPVPGNAIWPLPQLTTNLRGPLSCPRSWTQYVLYAKNEGKMDMKRAPIYFIQGKNLDARIIQVRFFSSVYTEGLLRFFNSASFRAHYHSMLENAWLEIFIVPKILQLTIFNHCFRRLYAPNASTNARFNLIIYFHNNYHGGQ